ncbi:dihydrolipoamide branched chain transacylase E2, partial [Reticulomyxa filosa]
EQISGLKLSMVKKMKESNDVPQFGYADEILMDDLVALRKQFKPLSEKYGTKLSFMPFILKAASLALRNYPTLNGHVNADCTQLIHRSSHNIGVAVDSPIGLIVPNIKDCQKKSVLQIALDLDALVERAKLGKITPKDIQGGTFTLSNIGIFLIYNIHFCAYIYIFSSNLHIKALYFLKFFFFCDFDRHNWWHVLSSITLCPGSVHWRYWHHPNSSSIQQKT